MRMSISVPDELKNRMDEFKDEANWSAVASRAFDQHLAELIKHKEILAMEDVINRLRASKHGSDEELHSEGFSDGREWATRDAEAVELQRLEDARDPQNDWHFGVGSSRYSDAENFYIIIHPAANGLDNILESFPFFGEEQNGEERHPGTKYVHGFAVGAMDVWAEVKGKL